MYIKIYSTTETKYIAADIATICLYHSFPTHESILLLLLLLLDRISVERDRKDILLCIVYQMNSMKYWVFSPYRSIDEQSPPVI